MNRLAEEMVFSGLSTAWRLASWPTRRSPVLVNATTEVASQKFGEARQRVVEKVESAKDTVGRVRDQAVECAKATDEAVRQHPYQALGIAFGVGALLGYLVSRGGSRNGD